MEVKHGQKYRVLSPKQIWERDNPGETYREPKIYGQGDTTIDRYHLQINDKKYEDIIGDVITASENVAYPHGPNDSYRNCEYIQENIARFELVEDLAEETEETEE